MLKSIHYQKTDPGLRWNKDSDIAIDSGRGLEADRALTPNVIKIDGGYRMYYHGLGPGSILGILSAFSADAAQWESEPGIRLPAGGEWATQCIWSPDVIPLPDGGYRMYFEGKWQDADDSVRSAIVSAVSDDGLVWEQEPGARLGGENGSYGAPRCLYIDSAPGNRASRYRLYASDFEAHQIVSAKSDDGLQFELEPGVCISREKKLESYEVYAPEVLRLAAGGYRMYYAGWVPAPEVPAGSKFHGRIFSAFSEDGLQWLKDPDVCLDNGGPWDTVKASEPCIIDLADGRFRMFYEACDLEGRWRIASATSHSVPRPQ